MQLTVSGFNLADGIQKQESKPKVKIKLEWKNFRKIRMGYTDAFGLIKD